MIKRFKYPSFISTGAKEMNNFLIFSESKKTIQTKRVVHSMELTVSIAQLLGKFSHDQREKNIKTKQICAWYVMHTHFHENNHNSIARETLLING